MDTPETLAADYLTPGDVARLLCVTPRTVSRWADEGRISHILTLGGHRRFLRSDVLRLVEDARHVERAAAAS